MERKKFWVLLVEDELLQAKFCLRFLRRFSDRFEVVLAVNREEALGRLSQQKKLGFVERQPVIILDYYLQNLRGDQLLPELIELCPEAMTIVITAYETPNMVNEVLNAGAIDYIFKTPDYYMHLPRVIEVAYERWVIRKQLEEELIKSRRRDEELAAAQLQLIQSEKMLAIRQLISGIMHELNNSLTSVIGFTQLLLNKQPTERTLDIIAREAEHARKIVNQLLAFSRQNKPTRGWFDFNEMLKRILELREYNFKHKQIELKQHLGAAPPLFYGDEVQLQQVFLNLVINAEIALANSNEPRRLEVKSLVQDEELIVTVQDNGPGVPDQMISKIFDPFFTTRPHGEGSGLGLSVCYGIVQEHQGTIEVINDQGACFTVRLPRDANNQTKATKRAGKPTSPARLLVADNDAAIRSLLSEYLEREGYQIELARDGKEALEKSEQQDFDALIIDCCMPVIDAIEFYQRLQKLKPTTVSRILFMTGNTANGQILEFLRKIDNPYIVKPFNIDDVLNFLQQILQKENDLANS